MQPCFNTFYSFPNKTHIIQFSTSSVHFMSFQLPCAQSMRRLKTLYAIVSLAQITSIWDATPHLKIRPSCAQQHSAWMTPCYHKNTLFWVEQQTQVAMSFSGFLMDASPPQHPNLRPSCHHGWGWRHPLLSSPTNLNHFQGPAHLQLANKGDLDKVALHLKTISGVMLAPFSRDKLIFNGRWSFCWDCKAFFSQWRSPHFPASWRSFPARGKNVRKFIINHLTVRSLKRIIRHSPKKLTSFQTLI